MNLYYLSLHIYTLLQCNCPLNRRDIFIGVHDEIKQFLSKSNMLNRQDEPIDYHITIYSAWFNIVSILNKKKSYIFHTYVILWVHMIYSDKKLILPLQFLDHYIWCVLNEYVRVAIHGISVQIYLYGSRVHLSCFRAPSVVHIQLLPWFTRYTPLNEFLISEFLTLVIVISVLIQHDNDVCYLAFGFFS